ncbi:hypothetical protein EAS61_29800 [Bradyrhizobium zhanjiangense]|uniref:Uncharacterized protein n=1 Tax=Bradyrhizobium zhanjiangense TaxID=1325107 RepID=A0A4Q0QDS5_9BRAD|nr:hypothetical protein EAS61_29800 [Bradyrhizobium zhanjiangense]
MRRIVLSAFATVLIAASAAQAFAAQSQHHPRKSAHATTTEQFRSARSAVARQPQPSWPYSGWSAPAGR